MAVTQDGRPAAVRSSAPIRRGPEDRGARLTAALAGPRPSWILELLLGLLVVSSYLLAPDIGAGDPSREADAFAHADVVVGLERSSGILVEPSIQRRALAVPGVVTASNWAYGTLHFAATPAVLIWLYRRRRPQYTLWRNTLAFASLAAFAVYRFWPLAPPRLAGGSGDAPLLQDTLASHPGPWSFDSSLIQRTADPLAAMPSMHVGWALVCAWAVASTARDGRVRRLAWTYPAAITVVIVVTGNHYLLDALGAAAVVGAAHLLALVARRAERDTGPLLSTDPEV